MVALPSLAAGAEGVDRSGIQSLGLRTGYGSGDRHGLSFTTVLPRVSLFFPRFIDEPLQAYGLQPEYVIEPIVSYITDARDSVEAGANLLFFSLRYDRGQALVPFLEGGEGLLYTNLRGEQLGTHFQFTSQAGLGVHWFLNRSAALSVAVRIRHISNAGITRENSGLNTYFLMVGFSLFPQR